MKSFAVIWARARRKMAPAPALTNISTMGSKWSTPKITDSATAPAAAASAKSHVGAGGAAEIALIAFIAASGANRPHPPGPDTPDPPHRRSHAIHIHAGRISRYLGQ